MNKVDNGCLRPRLLVFLLVLAADAVSLLNLNSISFRYKWNLLPGIPPY